MQENASDTTCGLRLPTIGGQPHVGHAEPMRNPCENVMLGAGGTGIELRSIAKGARNIYLYMYIRSQSKQAGVTPHAGQGSLLVAAGHMLVMRNP